MTDTAREALREVMTWIDNWSPSFTQDDEWPDTKARVIAALTDPRQPSEERAALTELHDAVCKATDGHSWPDYLWAAINRARDLIREKK